MKIKTAIIAVSATIASGIAAPTLAHATQYNWNYSAFSWPEHEHGERPAS